MIGHSLSQRFLVLGTVFAGSGVPVGAFGAHALKETLDASSLQAFDTATCYQMYQQSRQTAIYFKISSKPWYNGL